MNVRSWLTVVLFGVTLGSCGIHTAAPLVPLTTGDLLKHATTEMVNPTTIRVVHVSPPRLEAKVGGDFYWTDDSTKEFTSIRVSGDTLVRPAHYEFALDGDRLRAWRTGAPETYAAVFFEEDAYIHQVKSFEPSERFDLRANQGKPEGWLVLIANTVRAAKGPAASAAANPADAEPPKRRFFRVDIDDLEQKLKR